MPEPEAENDHLSNRAKNNGKWKVKSKHDKSGGADRSDEDSGDDATDVDVSKMSNKQRKRMLKEQKLRQEMYVVLGLIVFS